VNGEGAIEEGKRWRKKKPAQGEIVEPRNDTISFTS
jgi:hypothetical protein